MAYGAECVGSSPARGRPPGLERGVALAARVRVDHDCATTARQHLEAPRDRQQGAPPCTSTSLYWQAFSAQRCYGRPARGASLPDRLPSAGPTAPVAALDRRYASPHLVPLIGPEVAALRLTGQPRQTARAAATSAARSEKKSTSLSRHAARSCHDGRCWFTSSGTRASSSPSMERDVTGAVAAGAPERRPTRPRRSG